MRPDAPLFKDVLELRGLCGERKQAELTQPADSHSRHYAWAAGPGQSIAASLRVTRASEGELDCESFYPEPIVETLRPVLSSSSRLVRNPKVTLSRAHFVEFLRQVWAFEVSLGTRADVINCTERMVSYYQRLGYQRVRTPTFRHPLWGTVSHTLLLVATPESPGPFRGVFEGIEPLFAVPSKVRTMLGQIS